MAGFGVGIGAFMDGIERGKAAARAAAAADAATAQQAFQNDLATKNMELSQDANDRAGDASQLALAQGNQALSQGATTFGNAQADRTAMQPIVDAQRAAKLSSLQGDAAVSDAQEQAAKNAGAQYDALKARSIFLGKDAQGNPTFSVDGQSVPSQDAANQLFEQKHGTRMANYYNVAAPQIQQAYLLNGDVDKAAAFGKAHGDADFQRGVDDLGRLEGAAQIGNWDGVNEHLNNILGNSGYINSANHDATATPILGPDGRATGMTVHYKNNKTGEDVTKNFTSMQDAFDTLSGLISPQAAVAHNAAIRDALSAASVDAAKGQNKLANDISLANAQSANTIKENDAKAIVGNAEKRASGIRDLYKSLADNDGFPPKVGADGKTVEMTPDEKFARATQYYDASNSAAYPGSSNPYGAPAPAPILYSRPGGGAVPQAAPPAQSSPDDVISQQSRAFWQRNGVSLPWWRAPQAAPGAPGARGILEARDALAAARSSGPGSVAGYEAQHNLGNIPDVPPAPNFVPPMQQGAKAPMPARGEGVDAYEQRLGLAPATPPAPPAVIDNTPQGRSAQQYADSLRLSAADQIAQDAKNKRLTKAQRGW
jgi:hypothetical protein